MSQDQGVPAREVRRLFDINQRTLEYITTNGFVQSEVAPPRGRGTARLYSQVNLFQIGFLLHLREHGLEFRRVGLFMGMARNFMNFYNTRLTGPMQAYLKEVAYNPFQQHSLPEIHFFLDLIYHSPKKYMAFHLTDDRTTYPYEGPYAEIAENPADLDGWQMTVREDHAIQEIVRYCDSIVAINLTAISRTIDDFLDR